MASGVIEQQRGSALAWPGGDERNRRLWRWGAPAAVLILAAVARLWNLGHPHELVFDETYYVKDAWTLWNLGFEGSWPPDANERFNAGDPSGFSTNPGFVVHPPLGKWVIGLGMFLVGAGDPVGWRIGTAIAGVLAVALLMMVSHLLFRSTTLTAVAGALMAIDGNAIVMSRVALLDGMVMLLALAGFAALLLDRRWAAERLAAWHARQVTGGRAADWGPVLWWRPWLALAGVLLGLASAVKWSGLYFLAVFAVYSLATDALARRRAGVAFWFSGTLLRQGPVSFLLTVPVAAAAYLLTWTGWFRTSGGYYRNWVEEGNAAWTGALAWVPTAWQNFWHYQVAVYDYHVGEMRPHGYQANPLTWLLMTRPTSMYYRGYECDAGSCAEAINGVANPVIWWASVAAALYLVYRFARYRQWQAGAILLGLAAGYLPWLLYLNRTVFQFYTVAFEPYLLLALTAVLGLLLGRPGDPAWRRGSGLRLVAVFLTFAAAVSLFFWPMWTATGVPAGFVQLHYWLPGWR